MPAVQDIPETLTVPAFAERVGYSNSAIYHRLERGYIDHFRDAQGVRRIPVSEIPKMLRRDRYSRQTA